MKKFSLVVLAVLFIMSFTMMALAETGIVAPEEDGTVLVASANEKKEEPKFDYGYEKVTKSYASYFRYIYIGIAVLAIITMIFVEKKKFYRKPDPNEDPNKEPSKFDKFFPL